MDGERGSEAGSGQVGAEAQSAVNGRGCVGIGWGGTGLDGMGVCLFCGDGITPLPMGALRCDSAAVWVCAPREMRLCAEIPPPLLPWYCWTWLTLSASPPTDFKLHHGAHYWTPPGNPVHVRPELQEAWAVLHEDMVCQLQSRRHCRH